MPFLARIALLPVLLIPALRAQSASSTSANPVLYAGYSDPDVIRDGNDFYLVSSTFTFSPGLSILHSRDLVHWELAGHALDRLTLGDAAAQAAYNLAPGVPGAPAGTPGEPVLTGPMPAPAVPLGIATPDAFRAPRLGQQWEWNHNPDDSRWSLRERPGFLRLHPTAAPDLFHARNTLTESMQNRSLQFTVTLDPAHLAPGDLAGLSAFDRNLSGLGVTRDAGGLHLFFTQSPVPPTHSTVPYPAPQTAPGPAVRARPLLLRVAIHGDIALYSYSLDGGKRFQEFGQPIHLLFSWWKGARPALFSFNPASAPSPGWADFTDVQYRPLPDEPR